jgi:hypothetical protein
LEKEKKEEKEIIIIERKRNLVEPKEEIIIEMKSKRTVNNRFKKKMKETNRTFNFNVLSQGFIKIYLCD